MNKQALKEQLLRESEAAGIPLEGETAEQLLEYLARMLETNRAFNLTAVSDPDAAVTLHLVDSLTLASLPEAGGIAADVGTGAGFPGAVLKIFKPETDLTLIEATEKKLRFCERTLAELGLPIHAVHGRAEELARGTLRERFDFVCARAVAPTPVLLEYCLPLLRVGGIFAAMKGPEGEAELAAAERALGKLGGESLRAEHKILADGSRRTLLIIRKISHTPEFYPRAGGKIRKAPL